ncbi:MAG: DNA cytosine methyltransferase [Chloroflexota bacterium]|nr:DNA cytosine methyltransferase [Chloroflexota bacterium]
MRVIDLFAGGGGLSRGFANAGYQLCAAFDNWQPAIAVYRANFPDHPLIPLDLQRFAGDPSPFTTFAPDMIIGGPPCQDFSSAGKRDETLGRADLTLTFAAIVAAVQPSWFVMENVARAAKSVTYRQACAALRQAGYGLTEAILNAGLCGVPQDRKRLFLIGQRQGPDQALTPHLQRGLARTPLTVRQYLGNQMDIEHYYRHPRTYQRRAVYSIDEPSPTVRGVNRPIPPTYQRHPGDSVPVTAAVRPLTTHERSLIQTFPADFQWPGSKANVEQVIGNAVPVKLAEYIARCIQAYLQDQARSTEVPPHEKAANTSVVQLTLC